jgi:hypothetical protein
MHSATVADERNVAHRRIPTDPGVVAVNGAEERVVEEYLCAMQAAA